jgi:hypothetical protein
MRPSHFTPETDQGDPAWNRGVAESGEGSTRHLPLWKWLLMCLVRESPNGCVPEDLSGDNPPVSDPAYIISLG